MTDLRPTTKVERDNLAISSGDYRDDFDKEYVLRHRLIADIDRLERERDEAINSPPWLAAFQDSDSLRAIAKVSSEHLNMRHVLRRLVELDDNPRAGVLGDIIADARAMLEGAE